MKTQYRITKKGTGYFPQVRTKKFLFWSDWKKIAKHPSGFGLYDLPNYNYPKTLEECNEIIKEYIEWREWIKSMEICIEESEINNHNPKWLKILILIVLIILTVIAIALQPKIGSTPSSILAIIIGWNFRYLTSTEKK